MMKHLSSLAFVALACAVQPAAAQTPPPAISVSGEANVSVAPDLAQVEGGVTSEAKTAREASEANNAAMGKVLLALTGFALVLLNGFFVAAEFAIVKLRRTQADELAKELNMDRDAVIRLCVSEGVPIYQGKIDKWLFTTALKAESAGQTAGAAV